MYHVFKILVTLNNKQNKLKWSPNKGIFTPQLMTSSYVDKDRKIDNSKFKGVFRTKAKMLTPEQVDTLIGHSIGGVCPFAINEGCTVYLDESLKRFDIVYPAAGNAASAVELTPEELEKYANYFAGWIDVCK